MERDTAFPPETLQEAEEDYLEMVEDRVSFHASELNFRERDANYSTVEESRHDYDKISDLNDTATKMTDMYSCEMAEIYDGVRFDVSVSEIKPEEGKKSRCASKCVPTQNNSNSRGIDRLTKVYLLSLTALVIFSLGTAIGSLILKMNDNVEKPQEMHAVNLSYHFEMIVRLHEEIAAVQNTTQQLSSALQMQNIQLQQSLGELNTSLKAETAMAKAEVAVAKAEVTMAIENKAQELIDRMSIGGVFPLESLPISSCAILPLSFPSGYYWVRASNGSAVHVYCDMTRSCGGVTGGWMRVAELDMTNSSQECPSGFSIDTYNSTRTCRRTEKNQPGCTSIYFPTSSIRYSKVCGAITAYQFGTTNAFLTYYDEINGAYVDGVSLTHGFPREHIWTFAAALHEDGDPAFLTSTCICTTPSSTTPPPPFVGTNYFCDTGASEMFQFIFYDDNPLWDGAGCGPQDTCCSFNNPPWFYRQLPQPTTDAIEMRVCRNEVASNEDVAIQSVDLYTRQ